MRFVVESDIGRSVDQVFAFLRDIDIAPRDAGSVVPVLDKTSTGPAGVGSTYRELVRMLPGRLAEVRSEITRFDPPHHLDYRFTWRFGRARMDGALRYSLAPTDANGTHLVQEQTLEPIGALRLLSPLIRVAFARRVAQRMRALKAEAERLSDAGSRPPPARRDQALTTRPWAKAG